MRVIAGRLGGRNFASPRGHVTHPMSEKTRGALFNALGDIDGLSVLDAFTGSGALSFEAVSRGAARVLALDNDPAAQRTMTANLRELNLGREVKFSKAAAGSWLDTTDDQFDIVLLDPPYDHLQPMLLTELADRALPGGVVVLSLPPSANFELGSNFKLLLHKSYGDIELAFYRRTK